MEKTLIIYDNNGTIFSMVTGAYTEPVGLQYLILEDYDYSRPIIRIDTSVDPNVPLYSERELTEIEKELKKLQESNETLTECLLEISEAVYG